LRKLASKPQRAEAERLIKEGTPLKEVAKQTDYTIQHIRRIAKKIERGEAKPRTAQKPEATIEEIPPATPPPELLKEVTAPEGAPGLGVPTTPEIEAAIKAKDIEALFASVNQLLPPEYQRPKESMALLGKVWEAPLNRMMEKYVDQNIDIYIALITTIIIFAPAPIKYIRERQKKEKEKKPNDKGL